jgi:menaquinone-specific isochorismate synthase
MSSASEVAADLGTGPGDRNPADRLPTSSISQPAGPAGEALAGGFLATARALRSTTWEVSPDELPDFLAACGAPDRRLWYADGHVDLQDHGEVLLGMGEALRLPLKQGLVSAEGPSLVTSALRAISSEDPLRLPGTGPLAMGALPYDPAEPGWLSVPRLVAGRRRDRAWVSLTAHEGASRAEVVHEIEAAAGSRATSQAVEELPDSFTLSAALPHRQWRELVARAITEAEAGALTKVVVARRVDVVANRPFSLTEVLRRLVTLYPSCSVFHVEGFIGASPEILVRRNGLDVYSQPLAGTVPRSGDEPSDDALVNALVNSTKDRLEHQVVVDAIAGTLGRWCSRLDVPEYPSVVSLRNVSHLGTRIHGVLKPDHPPTSLELVAQLQPTPAVGGVPGPAAFAWQRANEGFRRGRYAGPVGWMDSRGDGAWAVGLRSADVRGPRAWLYAGAGVVAGSDPDAELAETQLKLQALLAALVRP